MSPYQYGANNPICNIDVNGDSTIYYSFTGELLYVSHDQDENAVTVLDEENTAFFKEVKEMLKIIGVDIDELDAISSDARELGDSYIVNEYWGFEENNRVVENRSGEKYQGQYREHSIPLYDINGEIRIGSDSEKIIGDVGFVNPAQNPSNPNHVANLHTHPNAGIYKGPLSGSWYPEPSGTDLEGKDQLNYYDIVVSRTEINFYNRLNLSKGSSVNHAYPRYDSRGSSLSINRNSFKNLK